MRHGSNIVLIAAALVAVLGIGGVHTAVAGVVAALALVSLALEIGMLRRRGHRSLYLSGFGIGFALATVVCFLQLVPVPQFVHRLLSPHGWEIVTTGFDAAGLSASVGWRPLSMDPAATADRALRFCALTAVSIAAANVYARHGWQRAARVVIGLGITAALVGGALHVTRAESIFGLYETAVGFRALGPFVNTNHGAVFFGFCAIVAGCLAIDAASDRKKEAVFASVCAIGFLVNAFVHNSEGTNLALLAVGGFAALILWWRAGRPVNVPRPTQVAIGLLTLFAAVLALWLDVGEFLSDYFDRVVLGGEHGNRLELIRAGGAAALDFWPAGAGMGATEAVIPAYIDWTEMIPASIPVMENDVVELLFGFGLIAGSVVLLALLATPVASVRLAVDDSRGTRFVVASLVALFSLLVAQMHFPLFALGLGVPLVAFGDVAWSRRMHSSGGERLFRSGHVAVGLLAGAVIVVLIGVGIGVSAHLALRGYEVELDRPPTDAQSARLLRLRPAEHRSYVRLSREAARAGETERAVRLAELALQREPSPRVRLFLARARALHEPESAVAEYRTLFETVGPAGVYLDSLLQDVARPDVRAELVAGHEGRWWTVANEIRGKEGPDAASSFVVELANDHPGNPAAYRAAVRLYMRLGEMTLARLWTDLLDIAERDIPAGERLAGVFRAQTLAAEGRTDDALEALSRSAREGASDEVHRFALRLRGKLGEARPDRVESTGEHYAALCASPIPREYLEICWMTEAWLAESDADYRAARRALDRVRRRFDEPMPLVQFYARHRQCARIEGLLAQLEPGTGQYKRTQAVLQRCEPTFE